LTLTVIHAQEHGTPKNRKKIDWKLLTDLSVQSRKDAVEKLQWYALRWKIEVFHKILKSGCKAEESRLRTAERLANLISFFCILSWRIVSVSPLPRSQFRPQHFLYFLPEPQGHGSLRPTFSFAVENDDVSISGGS
jgi:hypothetical protein